MKQADQSKLTNGEKRIANKIIQIYKDVSWNAYLYYEPRIKHLIPDFVLIDECKGVSIIEVKDWRWEDLDTINQKTAIINETSRENPINRTNEYFNAAKSKLQNHGTLVNDKYKLKYGLYSNLILTNLKANELQELDSCFYQPPSKCITSEKITDLTVNDLFSEELQQINENDLSLIRSIFFPEIKVKLLQKEIWEYSKKESGENSIIKTLDIEQEKFARRVPYGHYMVSGIPGSGKTVILLARAVFLAREHPDWKIKILTYTNSLNSKLSSKIESLHDDLESMGVKYQNIEVSTFHGLAKYVADIGNVPNPVPENYWDEIVPFKAIENAKPTYDAILIDEYQDFRDSWMKLCLLLCNKHEYNNQLSENIFLAGDRLQSIYNPSTHNWKSLGINIAGHSKLLKNSYRSGSRHVNLALEYLVTDPDNKREVETFYEGRDGICCNFNTDDNVKFVTGSFKETNSLLNGLLEKENYNPEDILVLFPSVWLRDKTYEHLTEKLKMNAIASKDLVEDKINLVTYHSAKGIETKVCILMDVDKVKDKKLLYVGMTRASEKLIIHSHDKNGGPIFKELKSCYNSISENPVEEELKPESEPSDKKSSLIEKAQEKNLKAYEPWNRTDELRLINDYSSGKKVSELAKKYGRSPGAIKKRLEKLGLDK
ncbi:UvrD-helicase domain-containing protein [Methanolobus sp. ZRKC5]|uniref:UvrD-helicase domain-containing protein n=1 Tax=unclassified Methanolobus TaxID=2629569 RepID=UPI00313D6CA7